MQNKKLIFIIVAVVILAIGAGAYYFSQKNNTNQASISNVVLSGDTWSEGIYTGKPLIIKWNSSNVNSVDIDLLNTQTSTTKSIVKNIKNTGMYGWEPEDIVAWRGYDARYKISVSSTNKGLNAKAESSIFGMGQPGPAGGLEDNWKTYTGYGVSFEYPSDWIYQAFNCNLEGVAFCPAKAGATGCGQTCGINSPESPIYFYVSATVSKSNLQLKDNNYKDIYNQILSTFKFTTPTGITADQQLKINNLDYGFVFTIDSVKIYDVKSSFLQELKIGKDEMATAKFDSKNYGHQIIIANEDVNFDGYKDLSVEIGNGYGGVNFFYNFYYFNPTTKKFVEVPELKSVCNPNVKYDQKQILSSCKDGPGYSDSIYQFGAAGYIITAIPKIYRIDPESASIGATASIYGNNFSGFEGDLNVWIENSSGVKGIIYGDKKFSDESVIKFSIPTSVCQQDTSYSGLPCSATLQLTPGNYKIFVRPWSTESNKIDFTIK
ncbi:MAG: hypothetical protein NTV36_02280 [Candidatus Staskawiczbacteria bacterium]|nr:hypothetical protein [Candidatus Staskawiczbacteria bacterium]